MEANFCAQQYKQYRLITDDIPVNRINSICQPDYLLAGIDSEEDWAGIQDMLIACSKSVVLFKYYRGINLGFGSKCLPKTVVP